MASSPRPLPSNTVAVITFALWSLFWVVALYFFDRPFFHRNEILSRGLQTSGVIESKWRDKGEYRVKISFNDKSGNSHSHSFPWSPEDYEMAAIGKHIQIHFLEENPEFVAVDSVPNDPSTLIVVCLILSLVTIFSFSYILIQNRRLKK